MWLVTSPSNKLRSSSHYIPTSQSDQRNVCGSYSHNMGIILHIKLLARNFLTDSWISVWDVNRRELWQLRCPDPPGLLHREHHHRAVRPSPAGGLGPGQEDQMYLVSTQYWAAQLTRADSRKQIYFHSQPDQLFILPDRFVSLKGGRNEEFHICISAIRLGWHRAHTCRLLIRDRLYGVHYYE